VLVGAGVVGVALVAVLAVTAGTTPYARLGNADPGLLARVGTPVLRFAVDVSATLSTGFLVFGACFPPPREDGRLSAAGYAAVRAGGWWALGWLVSALVLVPFDIADTSGIRMSDVLGHPFGLLAAEEEPRAWLVTAAVVLVVAVCARAALRWPTAVLSAVLAVFALLPPLVTGHASSDLGHDLGMTALLAHVPAAVIWLGTLVAFVFHTARTGSVRFARRYARLATGCWVVLLTSGLVVGVILVPFGQLTHSSYGLLVVAELVLTVVLGVLGLWLRRAAVARLSGGSSVRRLGRLVLAELVLLVGGFAVAVGQTHLPPPAFLGRAVTPQETLLGYDLAGPPTIARLALDWRVDLLFGPLALLLAVGYLLALRRRTEPWPLVRTGCWLAGCVVVLVSTSSGVGRYEPAMFSQHMASHMLLSMLAPVLLVLGAPSTLLASVAGVGRLGLLCHTSLVRWLTHPVVVLVLFAGSPFALYFTGLFDAAVRFHWAHTAIAVWFFAVGLLFAWVVVGIDPTPRRLPNLARLGLLLAAMPTDTVFAAILMTTHTVVGNGSASFNQYTALALPWVHGLLADQRLGGLIALAVTEVSLLAAVIVLLVRWWAVERAADADDERAMLERFRRRAVTR
jgi:putative copper resistance protein D